MDDTCQQGKGKQILCMCMLLGWLWMTVIQLNHSRNSGRLNLEDMKTPILKSLDKKRQLWLKWNDLLMFFFFPGNIMPDYYEHFKEKMRESKQKEDGLLLLLPCTQTKMCYLCFNGRKSEHWFGSTYVVKKKKHNKQCNVELHVQKILIIWLF